MTSKNEVANNISIKSTNNNLNIVNIVNVAIDGENKKKISCSTCKKKICFIILSSTPHKPCSFEEKKFQV